MKAFVCARCYGLCVAIASGLWHEKQDSGCHGYAETDRCDLDEY